MALTVFRRPTVLVLWVEVENSWKVIPLCSLYNSKLVEYVYSIVQQFIVAGMWVLILRLKRPQEGGTFIFSASSINTSTLGSAGSSQTTEHWFEFLFWENLFFFLPQLCVEEMLSLRHHVRWTDCPFHYKAGEKEASTVIRGQATKVLPHTA